MGLFNVDVGGIFKGATDLIGEYVEDKDKRNEINLKLAEAKADVKMAVLKAQSAHEAALLSQETSPRVDAFVKLLLALVPLMRPLGTAAMTVFGAYCIVKGVTIDPRLQAGLISAFPAWGVSRHMEKSRK